MAQNQYKYCVEIIKACIINLKLGSLSDVVYVKKLQ